VGKAESREEKLGNMADKGNPVTTLLNDSVQDQAEKMHAALEGLDSFVSKIFESRQAYYEKLTLLNGATLTLLFSAMGLLAKGASPVIRAQIVWPVFSGCWMLVVSIIICIVHNYINLYFLLHGNAWVFRFSFDMRRLRVRSAVVKAGFLPPDGIFGESKEADKHKTNIGRTETLCKVLGIVAQALTISAYVEFLRALHRIFLSI
jgi:hypothetical protein